MTPFDWVFYKSAMFKTWFRLFLIAVLVKKWWCLHVPKKLYVCIYLFYLVQQSLLTSKTTEKQPINSLQVTLIEAAQQTELRYRKIKKNSCSTGPFDISYVNVEHIRPKYYYISHEKFRHSLGKTNILTMWNDKKNSSL